MRRVPLRLIAVAVLCTTFVSSSEIAHAAVGADLSMNASPVGKAKARVGDTFTYTVTVTNLGPDASTGTYVTPLLPDALNPVSCSDATFCQAPGGSLAAQGTVTVTIVTQVCCFVDGDSRTVRAQAEAISDNDPNFANNIASVSMKIIGPHGTI